MWIHELRRALSSQNNPNVKIRISECIEPMRGCRCRDSDEGSTESLKGISSPTRGEWTGGHGIMGSDEGSTSAESLERPEAVSSPMRGEWTRGKRIAGFEDSAERLKRLYLNALLVCLLSILVYLLSSST